MGVGVGVDGARTCFLSAVENVFEHFHDDCHGHVFSPFSLLCLVILTSLSVGSVTDRVVVASVSVG